MLLLALWMATADPAQALLDQWVVAQNKGDFAAYERFYAQKFTGVRRSGPRVVRLDRKGWIKDRQRMFKHTMVVAASEVKIVKAGKGATVTFVQTWSAPESNYRDVGKKVIVLMPEGGALRIVREEMLESKLLGAETKAADNEKFALVVGGRVVITDEVMEPWSSGPPTRSMLDGPWEAIIRKVDAAKLPAPLRAWKGRKVRLFDFSGPVCDGTISGFEHVRRVVPHFSEKQDWKENKVPESEIAKSLWDEAAGSDLLLGTVDQGKKCKDAKWARGQSLPAPKMIAPEKADEKLAQKALREFRKLPAWKKVQADYQSEDGRKGNWDEYDNDKPEVKRLGPLVYVTAQAGSGCGDFGGRLFGMWEVAGDKLIPRYKPDEYDFLNPMAAVDVDGDGVLEILIDEGILRRSGDQYGSPEHLEVLDHDCPC